MLWDRRAQEDGGGLRPDARGEGDPNVWDDDGGPAAAQRLAQGPAVPDGGHGIDRVLETGLQRSGGSWHPPVGGQCQACSAGPRSSAPARGRGGPWTENGRE